MQHGWGAMGAGAWGSTPSAPPEDDVEESKPVAPAKPAFGAASFKPNPVSASAPSNNFAPLPGAPSPSSTTAAGSGTNDAALRKREQELMERERAVAAREKELGIKPGQKNNWPICMPLWHHDIAGEIPEQSRRVVREAYMCFWGLLIMLSYQVFCASVMLGYGVNNKVPSWFLSIIFWICGVPLSVILWYKRIYYAARDESSLGFVGFFFFFAVHWAFCVFCAIGVQINAASWSFSGFLAGFSALDVGTFNGVIYLIGAGGWSLLAVYSMWVLKDAWFFFRGQGGIQEVRKKAAQEAALAAFTNQQGSMQRV